MTDHVREERPKESNAGLVLGGMFLLCYAFTAFAGKDSGKIGADAATVKCEALAEGAPMKKAGCDKNQKFFR